MNAAIADGEAFLTIRDDDAVTPPTFAARDDRVPLGASLTSIDVAVLTGSSIGYQ